MPSKEEYLNPLYPSPSNMHWIPWIQKELTLKNILAQTPEMPEPYEPVYEKWCSVFEQFKIDEKTILIGHSCGGGFLVRWLSEHKTKVGKVVLVAPWIDPTHELKTGFFDFTINSSLIEKTEGVTIFISSDDDQVILDSVKQIKTVLKTVIVKEYSDQGHFTLGDMKTEKFPGLLDVLIK